MTNAEKIRRAVEEGEYVGDVAPLLAEEIKRLATGVAWLESENERLKDENDLLTSKSALLASLDTAEYFQKKCERLEAELAGKRKAKP